jgi:hypothetical protein
MPLLKMYWQNDEVKSFENFKYFSILQKTVI